MTTSVQRQIASDQTVQFRKDAILSKALSQLGGVGVHQSVMTPPGARGAAAP
jgi:hypothetical protein